MLIPSPRHRPQDLALWARLERVDVWHGARIGRKEEAATAALRAFASAGPCVLSCSWGKDSTVVVHLMHAAGLRLPVRRVRIEPGENPDTDLVRDAALAMMPGLDYAEITVHPGRDAEGRYVGGAIHEGLRGITGDRGGRYVSGIRAAESVSRRLRAMRHGVSTDRTCAPLSRWSAADVWGYLAVHGLPVHPAYACMAGGRWDRDRIRVGPISILVGAPAEATEGAGMGRREWEREFYASA